jgi:hypothetical protein
MLSGGAMQVGEVDVCQVDSLGLAGTTAMALTAAVAARYHAMGTADL